VSNRPTDRPTDRTTNLFIGLLSEAKQKIQKICKKKLNKNKENKYTKAQKQKNKKPQQPFNLSTSQLQHLNLNFVTCLVLEPGIALAPGPIDQSE